MTKEIPRLLMGAVAIALFGRAAVAEDTKPAKPEKPSEQVVRVFNETSPGIGELLPDIAAYDADGNAFPLRGLTGRYTVLTFGCLT